LKTPDSGAGAPELQAEARIARDRHASPEGSGQVPRRNPRKFFLSRERNRGRAREKALPRRASPGRYASRSLAFLPKKVRFPKEDLTVTSTCKKRANRAGWHFAIAALAAVALIQLISVAGLHVSAGMMASSRPGIGH
jgi:hypothetical protein